MALHIKLNGTTKMSDILTDIRQKIDDCIIRTWDYDDDGDFTQKNTQWANDAWMTVYDENQGVVKVGIIGKLEEKMSKQLYAIYHGRFAEMLLAYYDESMMQIEITSMKENGVDFFE